MRCFFKWSIFIILLAVSGVLYNFNVSNRCNLSIGTVNQNLLTKHNDVVDDTIFNLHYQNKVWTFNASEFDIDSNIFSINS